MLLVIRRDPTLADAGTPRCTPAALQGLKEQTERAPPLRERAHRFCGCVQFDHPLQMTHLGYLGDLVGAPFHHVRIVTEMPYLHDFVSCLANVLSMISCHGRPFVPQAGVRNMQETLFHHDSRFSSRLFRAVLSPVWVRVVTVSAGLLEQT